MRLKMFSSCMKMPMAERIKSSNPIGPPSIAWACTSREDRFQLDGQPGADVVPHHIEQHFLLALQDSSECRLKMPRPAISTRQSGNRENVA